VLGSKKTGIRGVGVGVHIPTHAYFVQFCLCTYPGMATVRSAYRKRHIWGAIVSTLRASQIGSAKVFLNLRKVYMRSIMYGGSILQNTTTTEVSVEY